MDRADFFRALYERCEALVEFRPLPGRGEFWPAHLWETPDAIDRFCLENQAKNIYFGVCTRDGDGGRKRNIVEIPAAWADLDFKDTPPAKIKENLSMFPFRPSIAMHTGGGYHLYWCLDEPGGKQDIPQLESVNRRIAAALGGDMNAVDAARILRIPRTTNHKRKKTVTLRHIAKFRYSLDDFMDLPEPERSAGGSSSVADKTELNTERLVAVFACRFLRWAFEHQAAISEPLWYAALSNLCRLSPGGVTLCHEFSRNHPGYSVDSCAAKILHALDAAGPHSCSFIKRHGFEDCRNCRAKSPLGLVLRQLKGK